MSDDQRKHDYRRNPGYEDSMEAELAKQAGGRETIRVRVMVPDLPEAEVRQLTTTIELMLEDFGWTPASVSRAYPCHKQAGVRLYVSGMREKKEENHG